MPPAKAAAAMTTTRSTFVGRGMRVRGTIGVSSQSASSRSLPAARSGAYGVSGLVTDPPRVRLLVTERFDWSEHCRAIRGIDAEEEPDAHSDAERQRDRIGLDDRMDADDGEAAAHETRADTDGTAQHRQQDCFGDEL